MNASGVLLGIAGAWVVTQVVAGAALERLGVGPGLERPTTPAPTGSSDPGRTREQVSLTTTSRVGVGSWA